MTSPFASQARGPHPRAETNPAFGQRPAARLAKSSSAPSLSSPATVPDGPTADRTARCDRAVDGFSRESFAPAWPSEPRSVPPSTYGRIADGLVVYRDPLVTVYNGGPVERPKGGATWIMPVTFAEPSGAVAAYDVVFVNCSRGYCQRATVVPFYAPDEALKLGSGEGSAHEQLDRLLDAGDGRPRIILRRVSVGNPIFPAIVDDARPPLAPALESSRAHRIVTSLRKIGIDTGEILSGPECFWAPDPARVPMASSGGFTLEEPVEMATRAGKVFVQIARNPSDLWKTYYLISGRPVTFGGLAGREVTVRFDSGCASGQIYGDMTCDCREQLLAEVDRMCAQPGRDHIIIHVPAQDGRGFGAAPKAETEIYKRGGLGMLHHVKSPLDTVEAADLLYDTRDWDLREYRGAARLLQLLEPERILLVTDNRSKLDALRGLGMSSLLRVPTETASRHCGVHIAAKHSKCALYRWGSKERPPAPGVLPQ